MGCWCGCILAPPALVLARAQAQGGAAGRRCPAGWCAPGSPSLSPARSQPHGSRGGLAPPRWWRAAGLAAPPLRHPRHCATSSHRWSRTRTSPPRHRSAGRLRGRRAPPVRRGCCNLDLGTPSGCAPTRVSPSAPCGQLLPHRPVVGVIHRMAQAALAVLVHLLLKVVLRFQDGVESIGSRPAVALPRQDACRHLRVGGLL